MSAQPGFSDGGGETGFRPLLAGQSILCLAPDPWDGLWRNRHQIMSRLARHNTVVYVEPRLYLGEAWRRVRSGHLGMRDLREPLLRRWRDNLYVYHDPVYAPFAGRRSGGLATAWLRRRALRRALASLGVTSPVLWLLRPFQSDQIGLYGERLVVYQVTDEYAGFPGTGDREAFRLQEEALLERADVVLVTSPALLAAKGRFNRSTHLVPNAVDFAGFRAAIERGDTPDALRGDAIPHPRVGYCGALNEKVDFSLLEAVARARPDWHLVLVGGLDLTADPGKADGLRGLPNVHWTGRVSIDRVPGAIAAMDVCLLPYERNQWTAHIDSLKLYEYLACGRPVVSTDVPAAVAFPGLVRVAAGETEFVSAVDEALRTEDGRQVAARLAAAAANTWDMRVAQIEQILAVAPAKAP